MEIPKFPLQLERLDTRYPHTKTEVSSSSGSKVMNKSLKIEFFKFSFSIFMWGASIAKLLGPSCFILILQSYWRTDRPNALLTLHWKLVKTDCYLPSIFCLISFARWRHRRLLNGAETHFLSFLHNGAFSIFISTCETLLKLTVTAYCILISNMAV